MAIKNKVIINNILDKFSNNSLKKKFNKKLINKLRNRLRITCLYKYDKRASNPCITPNSSDIPANFLCVLKWFLILPFKNVDTDAAAINKIRASKPMYTIKG